MKQEYYPLTVTSAAIVPGSDNKRVVLEFNDGDLLTGTVQQDGDSYTGIGYVVYFDLAGFKSADNEDLWGSYAYYTLNQFGPAEVVGCTDVTNPEYNPLAVYDDGLQCASVGVNFRPSLERLSNMADLIRATPDGFLEVHSPFKGAFQLELRNLNGAVQGSFKGIGQGLHRYSAGFLNRGMYALCITAGAHSASKLILFH
jgi:hypothetical protein